MKQILENNVFMLSTWFKIIPVEKYGLKVNNKKSFLVQRH